MLANNTSAGMPVASIIPRAMGPPVLPFVVDIDPWCRTLVN
jgi:hypothetical protein